MRLILRFIVILGLIYSLFWAGLAAYFTYAESNKKLLESNLGRVFKSSVSIQEFKTTWRGIAPRFQIKGLVVKGQVEGIPALSFESLNAELSLISLLRLWPRFTEFSVEKPFVEIVSLGTNRVQVAGLELKGNQSKGNNLQRFTSWLLDHESASWSEGQVVWRRLNGEKSYYKDISFTFTRVEQQREVTASVTTPKGQLAFKTETRGNLFSDRDWGASFEIIGDEGEQLLADEDLTLIVENGTGYFQLATLDVDRIRDFIRLTGLADDARWLLDAQLYGRLHDVEFTFFGPLLKIETWALEASASGVGFESVGLAPAMNNLSGELVVSPDGGDFFFSAKDSVFEWSKWFNKSFHINESRGRFRWQIKPSGDLRVSLIDGHFEDGNAKIFNLNAHCDIDVHDRKISNFAQLFEVQSVSDLNYDDDGKIVSGGAFHEGAPIDMEASVEFEVFDLSAVDNYIPNDERSAKFTEWWENAFISGRGFNGKASYIGEVSKTALFNDKATLNASADFESVELDYGYQQDWPILHDVAGSAALIDDTLVIEPTQGVALDEDLSNSRVTINSLFRLDRSLELSGEIITSAKKGAEFLFNGPLLKPENRMEELPIEVTGGTVAISVDVFIPLSEVKNTTVIGTSKIRDGRILLPEGVPVKDINADVSFTEKSASSDSLRAEFLGAKTRGKLITVREDQPPALKLVANGQASMSELEPWVGEHLLTWIHGAAPWQGEVLFDGSDINVTGTSTLEGVEVTAPAPLAKPASLSGDFKMSMAMGGESKGQSINIEYASVLLARMNSAAGAEGSLFDRALFSFGDEAVREDKGRPLPQGVNFNVGQKKINLDDWLEAVIEIAQFEPKKKTDNTEFLDGMRDIKIRAADPFFLGREFGAVDISAVSVDGYNWIGTLRGDNIQGTMRMVPRANISDFGFNLGYLNLGAEPEEDTPIEPIDYSLNPGAYPAVSLLIDKFILTGKSLGKLEIKGGPVNDSWKISKFSMNHNGIRSTATGGWVNTKGEGSISNFDFVTNVDEAEGVLDDMDFDGFIRKGKGTITGTVKWIGAPHEFDYSRLNGKFDMRIVDGELVKVEPGGGKLLGLLNFNAIARRLTFDFRDVFASGLKFDRMRYNGVFADGEAVMREAYILTPAVFVRMEGKLDLDKELIDMEVHMSPELAGNLTFLSALANPAAGAVVFLAQQIFKTEMRNSSFKSYRALGTWEDFELVEFDEKDELQ